jgi:hypothetical protein
MTIASPFINVLSVAALLLIILLTFSFLFDVGKRKHLIIEEKRMEYFDSTGILQTAQESVANLRDTLDKILQWRTQLQKITTNISLKEDMTKDSFPDYNNDLFPSGIDVVLREIVAHKPNFIELANKLVTLDGSGISYIPYISQTQTSMSYDDIINALSTVGVNIVLIPPTQGSDNIETVTFNSKINNTYVVSQASSAFINNKITDDIINFRIRSSTGTWSQVFKMRKTNNSITTTTPTPFVLNTPQVIAFIGNTTASILPDENLIKLLEYVTAKIGGSSGCVSATNNIFPCMLMKGAVLCQNKPSQLVNGQYKFYITNTGNGIIEDTINKTIRSITNTSGNNNTFGITNPPVFDMVSMYTTSSSLWNCCPYEGLATSGVFNISKSGRQSVLSSGPTVVMPTEVRTCREAAQSYIDTNNDVKNAGVTVDNAVDHYKNSGYQQCAVEGNGNHCWNNSLCPEAPTPDKAISCWEAAQSYLNANNDVKKAGFSANNAINHYKWWGYKECTRHNQRNRCWKNSLCPQAAQTSASSAIEPENVLTCKVAGQLYIDQNSDVKNAGFTADNAYKHYKGWGYNECVKGNQRRCWNNTACLPRHWETNLAPFKVQLRKNGSLVVLNNVNEIVWQDS